MGRSWCWTGAFACQPRKIVEVADMLAADKSLGAAGPVVVDEIFQKAKYARPRQKGASYL